MKQHVIKEDQKELKNCLKKNKNIFIFVSYFGFKFVKFFHRNYS